MGCVDPVSREGKRGAPTRSLEKKREGGVPTRSLEKERRGECRPGLLRRREKGAPTRSLMEKGGVLTRSMLLFINMNLLG